MQLCNIEVLILMIRSDHGFYSQKQQLPYTLLSLLPYSPCQEELWYQAGVLNDGMTVEGYTIFTGRWTAIDHTLAAAGIQQDLLIKRKCCEKYEHYKKLKYWTIEAFHLHWGLCSQNELKIIKLYKNMKQFLFFILFLYKIGIPFDTHLQYFKSHNASVCCHDLSNH